MYRWFSLFHSPEGGIVTVYFSSEISVGPHSCNFDQPTWNISFWLTNAYYRQAKCTTCYDLLVQKFTELIAIDKDIINLMLEADSTLLDLDKESEAADEYVMKFNMCKNTTLKVMKASDDDAKSPWEALQQKLRDDLRQRFRSEYFGQLMQRTGFEINGTAHRTDFLSLSINS
uniref:Uncharacterized protein n=1 Tax=Timema bartmani TaxID=61472 RepID=A0A7R9HYI3_9NEOP|nr:unnamed protein product [Timema bartmani]